MDPASRVFIPFLVIFRPEVHLRFLWRYHSAAGGERQGRAEVYTWTGKNAYVSLCEPDFLSFGGGCVSLCPHSLRF